MPLDKKTAAQSDRVPPNQRLTEGFPVLHYGEVPQVNLDTWDLRIFGFVDKEIMYTWEQILDMPHTASANDIHCVTGWSKLDNTWEGVLVKNVLREIEILPEAKFVMIHAEEGWTANLPLEDFMRETSLFARKHNGEELTPEHGWPLRLVIPHLYFWKSAKWVRGIEFMAKDRPGFWERNGYNMYGDPFEEQRFAWD